MKQALPIVATLVLGIFGTFGIQSDQPTVLALITGLLMVITSVVAIIKTNNKK